MREFASDPDKPSGLPYDVVSLPAASLSVQPNITTLAGCQSACSGSTLCTYFVFHDVNTTEGTSPSQCFFRLQGTPVAAMAGFAPTTSTAAILFEVREGVYAVFTALNADEATAIGTTLASGLTWEAARTSCQREALCAGLAVGSAANSWRVFSGTFWPGATAKVKAYGAILNSWVPESTSG